MAISADDVFAETMSSELIAASDLRAKELMEEYDTLQKLRKARALTQEHVGRKLGKTQVTVAQLEKRTDFLLSTLREYVSALGGELDLVVRFEGNCRSLVRTNLQSCQNPLSARTSELRLAVN